MTKLLLLLTGCLLTVLIIPSCNKEQRDPCLQPRTNTLNAHNVRHADTGTALLDTALPNPIIIPLSNQTTQYYFGGVKKVINLNFSLSGTADSSRWILQPDSGVALQDTLSFYYQRQLHFLSNACGYTYYYHLDSIKNTRNAVDSIRLNHADITTDVNIQNLQIIFK